MIDEGATKVEDEKPQDCRLPTWTPQPDGSVAEGFTMRAHAWTWSHKGPAGWFKAQSCMNCGKTEAA